MTSIWFLSFFLTFLTSSSGHLISSETCNAPPVKTIPVNITQFPNNSVIYYHALVNFNKTVDDSKCLRSTFLRSPSSETQATVLDSLQNLQTGAISNRSDQITELCPGIWEFQDNDKRDNFKIYYKIWSDDQSFVDLNQMYENEMLIDEGFIFVSTNQTITKEDIETGYRNANVTIDSLIIIAQDECGD